MKEKLLALLKTKFAGVPDATLDRIATKKAETVTDENQLQTIADGVTYGEILQSEVDNRVTSATKSAISNYEKKHSLKDGKPVTQDPPKKDEPKLPDDAPAWAKEMFGTMQKKNSELEKQLSGFKQSKTTETLQQTVNDRLLKEVTGEKDQKLLKSWLKGRTIDINSEDEVDTVVSSLKDGFTGFKQDVTNAGVQIDPPSGGQETPTSEKVSEEMKEWAESKKQSSESKND